MLKIKTKNKLNIHVVGAGGTGGYAIEYLTRLLAGGDHTLHIYDGDCVEPKNLLRQNFVSDDLDINKSLALSHRMTRLVDNPPTIVAHPYYITDKDEFLIDVLSSFDDQDESLVILMALDNIASRKTMNEIIFDDFQYMDIPVIVLDSGNDNQGGQVNLYTNYDIAYETMFKSSNGILPTMLQFYPELDTIKDDNPGLVQNCADNTMSQPQAMMCNVRNGELLANIIYTIYTHQSINANAWKSDILTGNTSSKFTGFYNSKEEV